MADYKNILINLSTEIKKTLDNLLTPELAKDDTDIKNNNTKDVNATTSGSTKSIKTTNGTITPGKSMTNAKLAAEGGNDGEQTAPAPAEETTAPAVEEKEDIEKTLQELIPVGSSDGYYNICVNVSNGMIVSASISAYTTEDLELSKQAQEFKTKNSELETKLAESDKKVKELETKLAKEKEQTIVKLNYLSKTEPKVKVNLKATVADVADVKLSTDAPKKLSKVDAFKKIALGRTNIE